jgi:hypothetical protein
MLPPPPVRLGPPCRRPILIATKYLVFRGQDTRSPPKTGCDGDTSYFADRTLPFLGTLVQEIQNIGCLFACWLSLALSPPRERLLRNSYRLGYFGSLLDDDVPIVSKRGELFFGRLHNLTIPEIGTTRETGLTLPHGQSFSRAAIETQFRSEKSDFWKDFLWCFGDWRSAFRILLLRRNYGNLIDARRDLQFLYSMR